MRPHKTYIFRNMKCLSIARTSIQKLSVKKGPNFPLPSHLVPVQMSLKLPLLGHLQPNTERLPASQLTPCEKKMTNNQRLIRAQYGLNMGSIEWPCAPYRCPWEANWQICHEIAKDSKRPTMRYGSIYHFT